MSAAIEKKIQQAKERYTTGIGIFDQEQGDKDLFKWLKDYLERAKKRKNNDILVYLATIGKAMEENPDETIELTLHHQEVRIAVFLASTFEDLSAIWYLEDLTMETLRRTKNREFNHIIKNMKTAEQPAEV